MNSIIGFIAPAATMIAAMMTAANVSVRVTGWGFVIFTIGSVCWSILGVSSGQTGLLVSNVFLTAVNAIGIYRWLGRQAKFVDGSMRATRVSKHKAGPTLVAAGSLLNASVHDVSGQAIGTVVDAMLSSEDNSLVYLVVSCGGLGGLGETLHALDPRNFTVEPGRVQTNLTRDAFDRMPEVPADRWPSRLPRVA